MVKLGEWLDFRGVNKKDGLKGDTVKGRIDSALGCVAQGIGSEVGIALSNKGIGKMATSKKLTGFDSINDVEMKVTIQGTFSENLKNSDVVKALDGLPPVKLHCSVLAEETIHEAIADYYRKQGKLTEEQIKEKCNLKEHHCESCGI